MLWLQGICSMPNALCWNNKIYQSEPSRNSFICRIKVIATDALVGPETNQKNQFQTTKSEQLGSKTLHSAGELTCSFPNWSQVHNAQLTIRICPRELDSLLYRVCVHTARYRGAARGYWGQRWSVQVAFQLACWAAISEGFSFSHRSKPTEPTWVETKGLMSLLNN